MALFIGIAFPFQKSPTAFPASAVDDALIRQSLIQLVLTGRQERVMRPDVGSGAYSYIFENSGDTLRHQIQTDVTNVIMKYEPRVALLGVDVTTGDPNTSEGPSKVIVTISYVVLATQQLGSTTLTLTPGSSS